MGSWTTPKSICLSDKMFHLKGLPCSDCIVALPNILGGIVYWASNVFSICCAQYSCVLNLKLFEEYT